MLCTDFVHSLQNFRHSLVGYAHSFVSKVLRLVNKNPQAHFLSSNLFVSVNQQGSDTIKIIF